MLGHFQFHWRNFKYLPLFISLYFYFFQRSLAMMTIPHHMYLNTIWLGDWFQPISDMSNLTATFLPTLMPQAMFAHFLQSITRWRLAAVMAVFIQAVFKRLYSGFHCSALRYKLLKQNHHSLFPFSIGGSYFVLCRQMEFTHRHYHNWRLYDLR